MERQGCQLCPRMCGAQRGQGELGFCGMPARLHAARAALHFWEEPPISGESGSGAVFFSGCSLGCAFCQNSKISQERFGKEITTRRLREIFKELIEQGARNINLVTPTQFFPDIIKALDLVRHKLHIPVVCNCGGYECPEILKMLDCYNVEQCCYGHLHGPVIRRRIEGTRGKTAFSLISADYLGFVPKKICE